MSKRHPSPFAILTLPLTLACLTFIGFLRVKAAPRVPTRPVTQSETWDNLGIYAGPVEDLAIDPLTGEAYAVLDGSPGIYRSSDHGMHWTSPSSDFTAARRVLVITETLHPTGTTTSHIYANFDGGLHHSLDRGETWKTVADRTHVAAAGAVPGFDVDPHDPDHIVIGTGSDANFDGGIYVSWDGGSSWTTATLILPVTADIVDLAFDPSDADIVYAVSRSQPGSSEPSRVFRSADGGQTFDFVHKALVGEQMIGVAVNTHGVVYAGTDERLYRSVDGVQWTLINDSAGAAFIEFSPGDPDTVYIPGYVSSDGGDAWSAMDTVTFFAESPVTSVLMFTGSHLGVKRSSDGGITWSPAVHGIENAHVIDVVDDPLDANTLYATTEHGLARSLDGGDTWDFPVDGLRDHVTALAVDPTSTGVVYAGTYDGAKMHLSADHGASWTTTSILTSSYHHVRDILVDPQDSQRIYTALAHYDANAGQAVGGLYRTTDQGNTWLTTSIEGPPVNAVAASVTPTGTLLYAGIGDYWEATVTGGVFRSEDGIDWSQVGLADKVVNALAVHPTDDRIVFAGTAGYSGPALTYALHRSTDGGDSWEQLSLLNCGNVESIAIDPNVPSVVLVSACNIVHISRDGGESWTRYYARQVGAQFLHLQVGPAASPAYGPADVFCTRPVYLATSTGLYRHLETPQQLYLPITTAH